MRKIIGFKLPLRPREIQRRAKKARLDLEAAGLSEAKLEAFLARVGKGLSPAVLYGTFPHPDPQQELLAALPGLAYSLVLATLGDGYAALQGELALDYPSAGAVWPLVQEAALDECVRFASSLLQDEATQDSCELSPFTTLTAPAALEAVCLKLGSARKIGVDAAEGRLSPAPSVACSLSWIAKTKAKGKS